jgi:tellurite resistance protein
VQCAVLLGMADGKLSEKERARIVEYASALGVTGKAYEKVENTIVGWVKSGDAAPML